MPGKRGGVTLKELQAKAKAAKIKGWSKMSKAELMQRVGGGSGTAGNASGSKKATSVKKRPVTTAKRYEATKVAGAIADKVAKKMGVSDPTARSAMQGKILTSVKKAVDKARKSPGATDRDVRKAAVQAVKAAVMEIRGGALRKKGADTSVSKSKTATKKEAQNQKSQPQKEVKPKEDKIEDSLKSADMSVAKELGIYGTAVSRVAGKSSLLGRFSVSRKAEDAINAFADETTLTHINNASKEKRSSALGKQFSESVDLLAKDAWDSLSKDQKAQSLKKQLLRDSDPIELESKIRTLKPQIDEAKRLGTATEHIGGEMVSIYKDFLKDIASKSSKKSDRRYAEYLLSQLD